MDRESRIKLAKELCDQHKCNEKVRKLHFDQIVNKAWKPHPPAAFVEWWKKHPENSIGAIRAFNCTYYVEQFNNSHEAI
jgi:hypothetical protein